MYLLEANETLMDSILRAVGHILHTIFFTKEFQCYHGLYSESSVSYHTLKLFYEETLCKM
jgi:hypothetical protein